MKERKKLKIKEAVVVEGKYDKNTLSQLIDAPVIVCNGFQVFRDPETRTYILSTARETGIIILTDADASGFMIRSTIHGFVPGELIRDAYIPAVSGKERRKDAPGKEGLLGVEGMSPEILLQALRDAGATFQDPQDLPDRHSINDFNVNDRNLLNARNNHAGSGAGETPITVADLYALGLTGCQGSAEKKKQLLIKLSLPSHLNNKELLAVLNRRLTLPELESICADMHDI